MLFFFFLNPGLQFAHITGDKCNKHNYKGGGKKTLPHNQRQCAKTTKKEQMKKTLENMWLFMRGMNTAHFPSHPLSRIAVTARANKDDRKGGKKDKNEEHGD